LLLTPNGEVIVVPDLWEMQEGPAPWPFSLIAKTEAARLYPSLSEILPKRPSDVPDCAVCRGSGHLGFITKDTPGVVGYIAHPPDPVICNECYGLGWVAQPIAG